MIALLDRPGDTERLRQPRPRAKQAALFTYAWNGVAGERIRPGAAAPGRIRSPATPFHA